MLMLMMMCVFVQGVEGLVGAAWKIQAAQELVQEAEAATAAQEATAEKEAAAEKATHEAEAARLAEEEAAKAAQEATAEKEAAAAEEAAAEEAETAAAAMATEVEKAAAKKTAEDEVAAKKRANDEAAATKTAEEEKAERKAGRVEKVLSNLLTFCGVTEGHHAVGYHELLCLGRGIFGDHGEYPTADNDENIVSLCDSLGLNCGNVMHEAIQTEQFLGSAVALSFYCRFLEDAGTGADTERRSQYIEGARDVMARIREAHQIYGARLKKLRQVYDLIDRNSGDMMSSAELCAFGETLHEQDSAAWSEERQQMLCGDVDCDGDMHCDFEEFCYIYRV